MKFFQPPSCDIASKDHLPVMLLRGAAGIALMSASFSFMVSQPMLGWTMLAVSILLLKGCPTCWGMHLVNAIRAKGVAKREEDVRHEVDITTEYGRLIHSNRRAYHPTDMAAHLFPPADVERFRREAAHRAEKGGEPVPVSTEVMDRDGLRMK